MTPAHSDDDQISQTSIGEPVTADAGDEGLRESLEGLSRLATGLLGLEETLTKVAQFSVRAIPGADGAGLTLLESDRADTIVASAAFVREIDDIQYGLGEGPCISAATEGRTMTSGSLGADRRWPGFGSRVARLRVHSVLSLPLQTSTGVVGAMNVYARTKHAFDQRAKELGELFAIPAAIAVQNAQVLAQAQRLVVDLQAGLDSRAMIDRAVGIMMSRRGLNPDAAFDSLRIRSHKEGRKIRDLAEELVEEAVRHARQRRR